tara:strand:+ start:729 stop:1031 length:303 start_codon:yes stop_codon:yes gene_type:complete
MDYRGGLLWRCVQAAINNWNPYNLVSDTEDDEFAGEVQAVCRALSSRLTRSKISAREISHLISRAFTSSFSDPEKFSPEKCVDVSEELFDRLLAAGLARN